jgi:hypothetical protein
VQRVKTILLVAAVAALCSAAYAGGNVIKYNQPVDENGSLLPSMNFNGTPNAADDFVCNGSGLVTDLHWWGSYTYSEEPLQIEGFNVRFYLNDGLNGPGKPGKLVYDVVYSGNAEETDTGKQDPQGFTIWSYAINIHPFRQHEGETYWLSISALPGWDPFGGSVPKLWGWRSALEVTGYEGVQALYGDHESMWYDAQPTGRDLAYYLTTVPEPGAVTAFAGLLLGLGGIVRRRR